jgi:hypothetical protein
MSDSATRRSVLPVEHLEAELLAAPLTSRVSFEHSLLALDPTMSSGTSALWREQERELLSRFPGMSIDELIIRRDRIWFGDSMASPRRQRPLRDLIRIATLDLLDQNSGTSASPESRRHSDLERRRRWRWTTFALPVDLMLASIDRPHEHEDFVCSSLQLTLQDRGFAESHLHLKAALEFPLLWASLQRAIAQPGVRDNLLAGPGAEFDEGRDLTRWLIRCSLSRLILAGFLASARWQSRGFGQYVLGCALPGVTRVEGPVLAHMLHCALRELRAGALLRNSPPLEVLRGLYASLSRPAAAARGDEQSGLDPLTHWFPTSRGAHPEFRFMAAAFAYMEEGSGQQDGAFARLFWQTQRLRAFFYRHIVQRPMTAGLQWFTRTYDRLSAPRRPLGVRIFLERAVRLAGAGLRSLEVRVAPGENMSDLVRVVNDIDRASRLQKNLEVGIVFHFIRSRGPDAEKGSPRAWGRNSHDDPSSRELNPSGYRFSGYFLKRRAEAAAMGSLLMAFPRMLERVRGIDLCTDELGIPLWVLLPLMQHVRRASVIAETTLRGSKHPVSRLRMTVHAGEDFVHLLGGIRRVGEAVQYLGLREGDRIGHGVALGVDVNEWAERATGLAIPRGERLFDLLWAWRCAMRSDAGPLRAWLPWVGQEACRLAHEIFGFDCSAVKLDDFVTALHSTSGLARTGFPTGPAAVPLGRACEDSTALLAAWLRDRRVFERAQVLVPVEIAQEVSLVAELQIYVRGLLARSGIVVEINPSSNLLIGHLGDLTDHPLWRLCPPSEHDTASQHVRVCIGSDDPITFSTRLPDEYQLLADAMVEGGLSMHQVDTWLERARAVGMAARFTVPRSDRELTSPMCARRLPVPI